MPHKLPFWFLVGHSSTEAWLKPRRFMRLHKADREPCRIANAWKGFRVMRRSYALILALPLLLNGCGGGSSNSNSSSASGSISGNWQMSLQKSNSTLQPKTQSGFLVQNGGNVAGSVLFTDIPCSGIGGVTGTVSGTDVSLVVDPVGVEVNLSGTVGSGQTAMSGNYTILSTGCSGTETAPQTGTWTASLVSPFSGNIQGT